MCGIAGIYPDGRLPPETARRAVGAMCARMRARGPDAEGVRSFGDGGPVLGHRRLSIIDLDPRSNQPLSGEDPGLSIVFNGEIYNYRELRSQLLERGEVFHTAGDTEVLLSLYRRHGRAMLSQLRGMFAFALWDAAERTLWLARDAYGIKPLYYAQTPSGFVFASQVKALLASGFVGSEPSQAGLAGFYLWGSVPEPWSMYRGISALPAGHWLEVRRGVAGTPRCHHDITEHWRAPARQCCAEETAERVRSAAADSVHAHCVADVPVSVFLSGGVDSGSILGLMASRGARVEGVTIGCSELSGRAEDEVPSARAIAAHFGVSHHVRQVTASEFRTDLPRLLDAMDQPSVDGVNTWFASKAAAERGHKVVLSGVGGDELLGGYASFWQLPLADVAARGALLVPGARRVLERLGALVAARRQQPKLGALGAQLASFEGLYQLRRGLFFPAELPALMGARESAEGLDALGDFSASGAGSARDRRASVALLESTRYLRNQLLRDSDWASMAHSLELRTPLVDTRLLEALAPYLNAFAHGRGKRLLAASPERPLRAAIVQRPKTGFGLPMSSWLRELEAAPGGSPEPQPGEPWARRWARYIVARWAA